jgi:sirohydrochlorin cobaltochelatase
MPMTQPAVESTYDAEARRRKADLAKPMASAPLRYDALGGVAWDDMWDSFCALASAGGPAHRASMLEPDTNSDPNDPNYQAVVSEIVRGIFLVSGLRATPDVPGWVSVQCADDAMAAWVAEQGMRENVHLRCAGACVFVPAGSAFQIKGEIKNVVTVIAKTTHYWQDHIANEMKSTLFLEQLIKRVGVGLQRLRKRL